MLRAFTLLALFAAVTQTSAQVVQLPSMQTFSVQTSMLVPDRGSAYLGGARRSSQSRSSQGWSPLAPTSRSGTVIGTGVSVHSTIIDHAELDALLLEEARAIREAKGTMLPDFKVPRITVTSPVISVAEIKRSLTAADEAQEAAAAADFQTAAEYERQEEYALARSYYRVAARKSNGPIRGRAAERLARLPHPKKAR